jgi:hypothetical protein
MPEDDMTIRGGITIADTPGVIRQYAGAGRIAGIMGGEADIIQPGGGRVPLSVGDEVHAGDVIAARHGTERVQVTFEGSDGAKLTVTGEDNALVVADPHQTRLTDNILSTMGTAPEGTGNSSVVVLSSAVIVPVSVSEITVPTVVVTAVLAPTPVLTTATAVATAVALEAVDTAALFSDHVEIIISFPHTYDPLYVPLPLMAEAGKYIPTYSGFLHPTDFLSDQIPSQLGFSRAVQGLFGGVYGGIDPYLAGAEVVSASTASQTDMVTMFVPPLSVSFTPSEAYNTPFSGDSGIGIMPVTAGFDIGTFAVANARGPLTYTLGAVEGNIAVPLKEGFFGVQNIVNNPFAIDPNTGELTLIDPLVAVRSINSGGITITVNVTDARGHTGTFHDTFLIQDLTPGIRELLVTSGNLTTQVADRAELLYNSAPGATTVVGLHDIALTGNGDDRINITSVGFIYIDAAAGINDIVAMSPSGTGTPLSLDLTDHTTGEIHNVENFMFGEKGQVLKLGLAEIFNMNADHTLDIFAAEKVDGVTVALKPEGFTSVVHDKATGDVTYAGATSDGSAVTLVVHEGLGVMPISVIPAP